MLKPSSKFRTTINHLFRVAKMKSFSSPIKNLTMQQIELNTNVGTSPARLFRRILPILKELSMMDSLNQQPHNEKEKI